MEPPSQLTWTTTPGSIIDGPQQGLSLSLSRNFEAAAATKFDKNIIGHGELMCFHGQGNNNQHLFQSSTSITSSNHNPHQFHFGFVESSSNYDLVRNSRYLRATQELLEEFCCVSRGHFRNEDRNPNSRLDGNVNGGDFSSAAPSSSKHPHHPAISSLERSEYQRRKIKLLTMLDEVCNTSLSLSS